LTKLLSTIQRDVPEQPGRSYQPMTTDSDDDSDDDFFLPSSATTFPKYSAYTPTIDDDSDDDDDDDDDDCDNWEDRCVGASSAGHCDGNSASAAKLPSQYIKQERQESVEQAANLDFAVTKSEDKQLAGNVSVAMQTSEMDTGTNVCSAAGGSSSESSADSDNDEMPTASWQRLPGNQGACELKVEGIDDVYDFISEIAHQPAAETTGKYTVVTDMDNCNLTLRISAKLRTV